MKAEQQLRESLKEIGDLKAALDEHAIVAITDPQGKITYVNDKFCAISKYSRAELLGQDHRLINSGFHPKKFFRDLWRTIAGGKVWKGELKNRAKDGSFYWVDTTIVPFLSEGGKPRQYVAIRADITERKWAEEELTKLNADLERRVSLRTTELQAANEELKAFSYSISHDLRAPLRAMGWYAETLERQLAGPVSDEVRNSIGRIRQNATEMRKMLDGLLDFASLGRQSLVLKRIKPRNVVQTVLEELRPETENRRVTFEVADLPTCEADPNLLKQVFANLISNALKYSRNRDPAVIKVGWHAERNETVFYVQDNGAGFSMKYADKLFQVFQRLHGADEFEGTGVGLAIVQRIVQRHGGRVWANAQPERGATFSFTLTHHDQ